MKKKIVLTCLILSLLLPTTNVFAHQDISIQRTDTDSTVNLMSKEIFNNVSQIPITVAIETVKSHMNGLLNENDSEFIGIWSDVSLNYSSKVYDITDDVIGYYFKVFNTDGENVGYYLFSPLEDLDSTPLTQIQ